MTSITDFLKKYGPILVALLAVAWNVNGYIGHWFAVDNATIAQIDVVLGFLGLGSFRVALSEAFSHIDLTNVGTWFTGKKTLIIAAGGLVFQVGAYFWGWTLDMPAIQLVNELAGALGVGTLLHAANTYSKEAQK